MIIEVDVPNVSFLAASIFCLDNLELVQVLDELFDILPTGLLDVVELNLLGVVYWKVRGNQVGDEERRRDW